MISVNEKTIRALVEAGAVKNVLLIADGATIHVDIVTQNGESDLTKADAQITSLKGGKVPKADTGKFLTRGNLRP